MLRTRHKTMRVALAILCIACPVARAADATLSGTVQHVDPQQGRLTITAGEDHVVELRAPAALLHGLRRGNVVEVTSAGQHATCMRRQDGVPRPDIGGALRLQPPVARPQSREAVRRLWRSTPRTLSVPLPFIGRRGLCALLHLSPPFLATHAWLDSAGALPASAVRASHQAPQA